MPTIWLKVLFFELQMILFIFWDKGQEQRNIQLLDIISIKIETMNFGVQLTLRKMTPLHEFVGIHFQKHHMGVGVSADNFSSAIFWQKTSTVSVYNRTNCNDNGNLSSSGRTILMKFSSIIAGKDYIICYFNEFKLIAATV